jgi:hypothetical protein
MKLAKMLWHKISKPKNNNSAVTLPDGKSGSDKSTDLLYLYVSDCGWRARCTNPEGVPIGEPLGEDLVLPLKGQSASINNIIAQALDKIGKRTLGNVELMTVVLDDPNVVFVEDSVETEMFSDSNVAVIRKFGCEYLGVEEVSYGYARLGLETHNEPSGASKSSPASTSKGGVYSFIEVDKLRGYLAAFGDLAPKIVVMTPAAHAAILGSVSQKIERQCHIFISAYSTVIVIFDLKGSVVVIRSIPVGVLSISNALANAQGLAVDLALSELQRRDCITPVFLRDVGDGGTELPNQFERVLGPVVRQLGDEIENTLSYFRDQRGGSGQAVSNLVVHGAADRIQGLTGWLSNRLLISVNNTDVDCLKGVMNNRPREDFINLLVGAQGPLFKLGKADWTWNNKKKRASLLETEAAQENRPNKTKNSTNKKLTRRSVGKDSRKGQRNTGKRGSRGGASKEDGDTFFGLRLGLSKNGEDDERLGFGLLALCVAGIIYFGYTQYIQPKLDIRKYAAISFTNLLAKNASLRREVERRSSTSHLSADIGVSDKVLWTEKFLALGCYASEALWLTSVYLSKDGDQENLIQVKKLVIEGSVLPSYDGHLLEIASFIRRLEEDPRNLFMTDFKTITFEGASVDFDGIEQVVKFTIKAWYDSELKDGKRKRPKMMSHDLSIANCGSDQAPPKGVGQQINEGQK